MEVLFFPALNFSQQFLWVSVALLSASVIVWWNLFHQRSRSKPPLPPGPNRLPVFGNLFQLPRHVPWRVYNEWSKIYGDVIYLEAAGQKILVVNSLASATALMVKRAPNYSDREPSPIVELLRFGWSFATMNYGQTWRSYRRAFHQSLNQTQIHRYHPIIEEETVIFLKNILSDPKGFRKSTRYLFGTIIMRIAYGAEDPVYNQELVDSAGIYVRGFAEGTAPGKLLVGMFPILKYVPSWLPGAGWKRELLKAAEVGESVISRPYVDAKIRFKKGLGKGHGNISHNLLEKLPSETDPGFEYQNNLASHVAAAAYIAGSDTTVSSAIGLILALAMHPGVQQKAQAEMDALVGCGRLPNFQDFADLPYLQAIVKEVGRWHTVVPFGLPHFSNQDDIWNGYYIPGNTILLPNQWAMMHDPEVFDKPMEFQPERYLKDGKIDPSVLDPEAVAFGFGRRICPGRHLSNTTLTMMAATLIHCFDVKPSLDAEGNPIKLKLELESDSSILSTPAPFQCDIVPRSAKHVALIHAT